MSNIVNIYAESGANMISDDATPALTLSNSGGGFGLEARGAVLVSSASRDRLSIGSGTALAANATIVGLNLSAGSFASNAVLRLVNLSAYVSTSTIKAVTAIAANCGAIRVVRPDGTFGWIPVYPDAAITAIAV